MQREKLEDEKSFLEKYFYNETFPIKSIDI